MQRTTKTLQDCKKNADWFEICRLDKLHSGRTFCIIHSTADSHLIWHFLITELAIESGPDMFIPFQDQVKFPLKISGDPESLAWRMNGSPTRNKQPGETPSFIPLPRDTKANGQCLQ